MYKLISLLIAVTLISWFTMSQAQNQTITDQNNFATEQQQVEENLDSLLSLWYIKNSLSDNNVSQSTDMVGINFDIPDSVYMQRLAAIPTTFPLVYNEQVRKWIELYAKRGKYLIPTLLGLSDYYFPLFEEVLDANDIPLELKYLPIVESALNPRAVSPAGAVGFWQFLDGTAKEYGLEVNKEVDERYHIEKSTYAFCKYVRQSYNKYGSWTLAAASYNGGMARVQSQQNRQKMTSYYDLQFVEETQRYVFRITALKLILENPKQYNFVIEEDEKYPVIKTREVNIDGTINSFADFAIENGINYKLLKDFNPWLRDDKLTNSAGKLYSIRIPVLK